jgi:hypothetical protein
MKIEESEPKENNRLGFFKFKLKPVFFIDTSCQKTDHEQTKNSIEIEKAFILNDKIKKSLPSYLIILHAIVLATLSLGSIFLQSKLIGHGAMNNYYIGFW